MEQSFDETLNNNMAERKSTQPQQGVPLFGRTDDKTPPLTFAEKQMAIEYGLNPESVAYNANFAFHLRGAVDKDRLTSALNELIRRHIIFRASYRLVRGDYVREIAEKLTVSIACIPAALVEVRDKITALNTPFDLAQPPLMRVHLFECGAEESVLHFCMHHIIIDGTSAAVVADELWRLYRGEQLPEVALNYLDYAAFAKTLPPARGLDFFEEMFREGVPENDMPTRVIRPEELPAVDTLCTVQADRTLVAAAARRFGVTTFELLAAALGLTLAKYTGGEAVVLGTAMSGRTDAGAERIMGMFVNTLPMLIKPDYTAPVADYLRQVRDIVGAVKRHQTCPFEKIAQALVPERTSQRAPVFDVMLNYLNELPGSDIDGLNVSHFAVDGQALRYDMVFEIFRGADALSLSLAYSEQLYEPEIINGFMEQFVTLLARLDKSDGTETLEEISELPENQRRNILDNFGGRETQQPGESIVDLFRAQAAKTPQKLAVVSGETRLTYQEFDRQTDRLASCLMSLGVKRGDVVGVMVRRTEMMPVCSMGVLKAGAIYMPMELQYPDERLEYMAEDSNISVMVKDRDVEKLPGFAGTILYTDALSALAEGTLPAPPALTDGFIVLYTSGTTGKPKGVRLSHANVLNFSLAYQRICGITSEDSVPAYASFGFDANMMDTYPTLISGACLHVIKEEMRLDLLSFYEYIKDNALSVVFVTTQLGRQLAEMVMKDGESTKIRTLSVGGETLVPLEPPKNFSMYDLYGPTECTVFAAYSKMDRQYDRVPIGKPTDNTQIYILDRRGHLAPVGVLGELCIAGRQVGQCYQNRPDLTEEKFVPNPFCEKADYSRMYLTGDIARYLPDGNIDFIGRRDFQVKIRGFRIELTEIEARIREHESVRDATVVAFDTAGGKGIAAYVVSDAPVDAAALGAFVEETLPYYMVPSAFVQLEKIPLNQNGKVDKRALPEIQLAEEEIVAPETPLQAQVLNLAAEVLGIAQFGITSDLLFLGLSSLSAIKLSVLISEQAGKKISAPEIMRAKTVEKICALMGQDAAQAQMAFEQRSQYPLTENQMGLYYECMKKPDALVYNIPIALTLPGARDVARVRQALEAVVAAHPYIKTCLTMSEGTVYQLRRDEDAVEITAAELAEDEFEVAKQTFVRPFHLFGEQLFRLAVYKTPKAVYVLADFHHIIFDGWSLNAFLKEFCAACEGAKLSREQFTSFDLALLEEEAKADGSYQRAEAFFEAAIARGDGATLIPTDQPKAAATAARLSVTMAKEPLNRAARSLGITPANLFLGAVCFVTSRFANTKKVGIATISNGRDDVQLQNNLGMLVKTLPVLLDVASEETAADYLRYVHNEMLLAMENDSYPYTMFATKFQYHPQILYSFQGGVVTEHRIDGTPLHLENLSAAQVKFPIDISIEASEAEYAVEIEYDASLFYERTIRTLAECIAQTAKVFAAGAEQKIGSISIADASHRKLIERFASASETAADEAIFEALERMAVQRGADVAVIAPDATLTYRELNARANKIANALLDRGLQKEDTVAFMLPRSSHVFAAIYGISKAGGAFIPVDPEYPRERIAHVLGDSRARFLITDGESSYDNGMDIHLLLGHENDQNPQVPVARNDLCYIIYTSGSTGKPKGVMLEHRGAVNYGAAFEKNLEVMTSIERNAVYLSVTTVSFDAFLADVFIPISNGLRVVMASEEQTRNPAQLAALIEATGANAATITPSVLMQYMELPAFYALLPRFEIFIIGAERFPKALYAKIRAVSAAAIFNSYGPTEATIDCNCKIVTEIGDEDVPIGRPENGVVEQIMDMDGNLLPVGVVGELWIGGVGVARGYFGRADLTGERFVRFGGETYYKSGDLAKWNAAGEVIVLGRNDSQVKLRGLRIELSEVENAIAAQPGITRCVVRVMKIRGQEHLCAYFTAEQEILVEQLREEISKTLTKYMVPTAYLQLAEMPVTPNGKIDAKALPEAKLMAKSDYAAPENQAEKDFCDIFAAALGMEQVGALDNFFDLGGTSLLVTQITIDALNKDYKIVYADVFNNPTPRELAAASAKTQDTHAPETEDAYDYAPIHQLLAQNTRQRLIGAQQQPLGNVCITGVTGFLGIHMLKEFLDSEDGVAYCVVRGGATSPDKRLKNLFFYYFGDAFEQYFGNRIVTVEGDICDVAMYERLDQLPIDTYINCAANVKHFSAGTDIEDINIKGVEHAITFCRRKKCRLIQISTTSIAGLSLENNPPEDTLLNEQMLYFGQDLSNKYVNSKFIAERKVLTAVVEGLDAKIMRVGNLMARSYDGEFQINFQSNNFIGMLRAYKVVGKVPFEDLLMPLEFSPIDTTARAILRLCKTPKECTVFHPYNNHVITFGDVLHAFLVQGLTIVPCESDAFIRTYNDVLKDKSKARYLSALFAYNSSAHGKQAAPIGAENDYTTEALFRSGFQWPILSEDYFLNFIKAIGGLGFFDTEEL